MGALSVRAVLVSILVVLALDVVAALAMLPLFGRYVFDKGMTLQQLSEATTAATKSFGYLSANVVVGTIITVLGGFLAARLAQKGPYINAGLVGLFGFLLGMAVAKSYPFWFNLAGFVTVIPAALLGGHLGREHVRCLPPQGSGPGARVARPPAGR